MSRALAFHKNVQVFDQYSINKLQPPDFARPDFARPDFARMDLRAIFDAESFGARFAFTDR
jgi:hypothetical protein